MAKRRWSGAAKRSVRRYNAYRRAFDKRVNKMLDQGLTPYDGIPLSYREYNDLYAEERNDRIREIEKGKRSRIGDINAKIISNQVYELSEEQAYAIFDYMKTLSPEERASIDFDTRNINKAIAKIRQGEFVSEDLGLWDIIRSERDHLFSMDKDEQAALVNKWRAKLIEKHKAPTLKNAISYEISHTYFGSN